MGNYLRIARAYLSGTAAAVWCISFYFIRRSIKLEEEVGEVARTESGKVGK